MDNNTVIVSLAGSIVAIVGIVVLLVKLWIDSKKNDNASQVAQKQCLECAKDHLSIRGEEEAIKTRVDNVQKTVDANQETLGHILNKVTETLTEIRK